MNNILYLRAKNLRNLSQIIQALHAFFWATRIQEKEYPYGISFPEINKANTGTLIGVHNLETPEHLLTFLPVMRLLISNRLTFVKVIDLDLAKQCRFAAFIRDRKLERGAPPRVMTTLKNQKCTSQKAQHQMTRYFEEHLPKISMQSSGNKRNFTLHINTINANEATSSKASLFNSYGLSTYQKPIFLPVPAVIDQKSNGNLGNDICKKGNKKALNM